MFSTELLSIDKSYFFLFLTFNFIFNFLFKDPQSLTQFAMYDQFMIQCWHICKQLLISVSIFMTFSLSLVLAQFFKRLSSFSLLILFPNVWNVSWIKLTVTDSNKLDFLRKIPYLKVTILKAQHKISPTHIRLKTEISNAFDL